MIIEYADNLYNDDEAKHLLEALDEFVDYPNSKWTTGVDTHG